MNHYTRDRALWAANALIFIAIAFGAISFWADFMADMTFVRFVVAFLLTLGLVCVSFLLSGVVIRYAEAREEHELTSKLVAFFGFGLGAIEAVMTHRGLAWVDTEVALAPDALLWFASIVLSVFNVFALYVFAREIKAKTTDKAVSKQEMVFGPKPDTFFGQPGDLAAHNARMDDWERKMATDPERLVMPKHRTPSTEEILSQVRQRMMNGH